MLEHLKYICPDLSIPVEFLEAEYLEESSIAALLKISEVLVTSPPIEEVVCFSASVLVLQKTIIIPIATVPIQQVSLVHSGTLSPIVATEHFAASNRSDTPFIQIGKSHDFVPIAISFQAKPLPFHSQDQSHFSSEQCNGIVEQRPSSGRGEGKGKGKETKRMDHPKVTGGAKGRIDHPR